MKTKIDYFPKPKICPYCGNKINYISSKDFYGKDFGMMYLCSNTKCNARVLVHRGTNIPKGYLATDSLLKKRKQIHDKFDKLWRNENERMQIYKELARRMKKDKCHFAWFTEEELNQADKIINSLIIKYKKRGRL